MSLFSVSIARCCTVYTWRWAWHGWMDGWMAGWLDGLQFASIRFRHDAILDSASSRYDTSPFCSFAALQPFSHLVFFLPKSVPEIFFSSGDSKHDLSRSYSFPFLLFLLSQGLSAFLFFSFCLGAGWLHFFSHDGDTISRRSVWVIGHGYRLWVIGYGAGCFAFPIFFLFFFFV